MIKIKDIEKLKKKENELTIYLINTNQKVI